MLAEHAIVDQPVEDARLNRKPYAKPILTLIDLSESEGGAGIGTEAMTVSNGPS